MSTLEQNPLSSFELYKDFQGYHLFNVYQKTSAEICELIIDLWLRNKVLPKDMEPSERAKQTVLMALNGTGELIGVNTAYIDQLSSCGLENKGDGSLYYFYRMFIQPQDRKPEMMRIMTNSTFDILKNIESSEKPKGMVIIAENSKLARPGMLKMFNEHGYNVIGEDRAGHHVILKEF